MAEYRESFIFRLATEQPALLWTGHGDILLPADAVLPEPAMALGGGDLINLPDLEQLINGTASRIDVVLSGVSELTASLAAQEASEVPGAPAHIGRLRFDDDWQPLGPVEWEWEGEGRGLAVSSDDGDDGRTRTLTLKLGSGDTTRSRAALAFFTDADQTRDFPTDTIFANVAAINVGTTRRWGPH